MTLKALLYCTLVFAPGLVLSDDHNSLAIEWQRSQETLVGANRSTQIRPEIFNLHYAYQFNDTWSIGLSGWTGEDQRIWNDSLSLIKELQGLSVSLGYQQDSWWLDFGGYFGRSDTRLRPQVSGQSYSEQVDTFDISVNFNYDLDWQGWWFTPALGFGYQQNDFETRQTFMFRDDLLIRETQFQNTDGVYLSSHLNMAYPLPLSETVLVLPALSLGWTEPVRGTVLTSTRLEEANANSVRRRVTTQSENDDSEGSGFVGASVSVLFNDYSVDLALTKPLDDNLSGILMSIQLGVSF